MLVMTDIWCLCGISYAWHLMLTMALDLPPTSVTNIDVTLQETDMHWNISRGVKLISKKFLHFKIGYLLLKVSVPYHKRFSWIDSYVNYVCWNYIMLKKFGKPKSATLSHLWTYSLCHIFKKMIILLQNLWIIKILVWQSVVHNFIFKTLLF